MTSPLVLGIDPGVSGAAVLCRDEQLLEYLVFSTPDAIVRIGKSYTSIGSRLMKMMEQAQLVALEAQRPLGKATRAFATTQLSFFCGTCYQAAEDRGIRLVFVQPNTWKRHFQLAGKDKLASLSLMPTNVPALPRSQAARVAIADAYCVAMYARYTYPTPHSALAGRSRAR